MRRDWSAEGTSRWFSPENPTGSAAVPALSNRGAKGRAFVSLAAGRTVELARIEGCGGAIGRIWLTLSDLSEEVLRGVRIRAVWDRADTAAVDVPLGAFFGQPLDRVTAFESSLFSSPEGRSLCIEAPMGFREAATIELVNDTPSTVPRLFYEVNALVGVDPGPVPFLHCSWRREERTPLGEPFAILPEVRGRGRVLAVQLGVRTDPRYAGLWWGEGEVQLRLDAETGTTLSSTGVEDYVGTGWGMGAFAHRHSGCPVAVAGAGDEPGMWSPYRIHADDPVVFARSATIWIRPIGGATGAEVARLPPDAPVRPVSIDTGRGRVLRLLEEESDLDAEDPRWADDWVNFDRSDDYSATVWYLLDSP